MRSSYPSQSYTAYFKNYASLNSATVINLTNFIARLNQKLIAQPFEILNHPSVMRTSQGVAHAVQETQTQAASIANHGRMFGTTTGLRFVTKEQETPMRFLNVEEIRQYYNEYINLIFERKNGTCTGLCVLAFHFATELLQEHAITEITVDICDLKNWSHTLIRLVHNKSNGTSETLFYDPWFQSCFTATPNQPKVYSEENFGRELQDLISKTKMIQRTTELYDLQSQKMVENNSNDFSYFISCSTGVFMTPALAVDDPTFTSRYSCTIS